MLGFKPENRPIIGEICECLKKYYGEKKIIELAESKRQETIKSEKYLNDEKNHKNHPESFYTSRVISKLIEKANPLSISSNKSN